MTEELVHYYKPFKIEAGKINAFAKAIGIINPIYFDRNEAQKQGYSDIPIPPTFATVIEYSNERDYYQFFKELDLKSENVLHGEQTYEYIQDICANDTVTATLKVEGKEYKGDKIFYYLKTIYKNQFSAIVLVSKSTLIDTGEVPSDRKDTFKRANKTD
ncbi:MaoC family dehydratase N-terminal domain-containing protein [Virgibacillus byunsanensis]|uniref:MaoC family dehydratase N-terminal domain-containing protein n=1 Tax=Virgibacillus byunsanensis TaxID=570945 RepID=A0ABW3LP65_9BACI